MPPSLACGQQWIETVLTCEGDYYDPDLPRKLTVFNSRLQQILRAEKERLVIKKVEPWNSVKVTLNIPPEAALRLRALAEDGSQALRNLGILAVQVEGDRVISLTLAGNGTGLQRTPTVGASTCSPSCTAITGNNAVGLSQCSDRSTLAADRLLNNSIAHKLGSPPPAINGCLSSVHPTSLNGQREPAKRSHKATGSSRAGSKKQALDQGSAGPPASAASATSTGTPGSLSAASAAGAVPASLPASSVPKPRYHLKGAASDAARPASDAGQHGAALRAKPAVDARSARGPRSSASCLASSLVGSSQPSTSRAAPPMQMAPGLLGQQPSPASGSSMPPAAGESIKAINDIITSLHAAPSSRSGAYAATGEPSLAAAAAAPAVPSCHRLANGRAATLAAGAAAAVTRMGNAPSRYPVQAHPHRAVVDGGSSTGQLGGCGSSSGALVMAKHLYHPAGEDRHMQEEVYRMHSLSTSAAHRGSSIPSYSSSSLFNSGAEPPGCSADACPSDAARVDADGLHSYEQQQQRSGVASRSPRRPQPPFGGHSSHACTPGVPSMMERDSSTARNHGGQDTTGAAGIVHAADEPLQQGRVLASASFVHDRCIDSPSPADLLHPGSSGGSGGCGKRGRHSAAVGDSLRHCESPTVVDHLEGTIMSVAGDEGEDSAAISRTTYEERDGICVVNIGVTQTFPAMQDDTIYAIPPCLDIAKVAADLQSSQDSPLSSPTAMVLAALSKHESASSETETESGSAVSVDSGIASSSPKSDLGEAGASSAAHTPGGSEHEVQLLGAAMLRTDAIGDLSASSMQGACSDHSAVPGGGLWVATDGSAPSAATAATAVVPIGAGAEGGSDAVLLPSHDVLYRGLPAGGWQGDSRHGMARPMHGTGNSTREHEEAVGAHRIRFGGTCQGLANVGISSSLMQESSGDCKPAAMGRISRSPCLDQHMRATRSQAGSACKDSDTEALARDSRGSRRTGVEQPFITIHSMVNVVELQALPTTCRERKRPINHT